jgi:hypothetical protein
MNQRDLTDRRYFAVSMRGLRGPMSHYSGSGSDNRQAGLSGTVSQKHAGYKAGFFVKRDNAVAGKGLESPWQPLSQVGRAGDFLSAAW